MPEEDVELVAPLPLVRSKELEDMAATLEQRDAEIRRLQVSTVVVVLYSCAYMTSSKALRGRGWGSEWLGLFCGVGPCYCIVFRGAESRRVGVGGLG